MDLIYDILSTIAPSQLSGQSLEIVLGLSSYIGLILLIYFLYKLVRCFF